MKRIPALLCAAALLAACTDQAPTAAVPSAEAPGTRTLRDDVAGVTVAIPREWSVVADPVLFNTYGFALFDPSGQKNGGHARSPVARVALAYEAKPADVEGLVSGLMSKYGEFPLVRSAVEVGGRRGVAVSGLPGTDPYTLVYVADGDRVYRIGVWTAEPGLDARARMLLAGLRFHQPRRDVRSLGLTPVREAMHRAPPAADVLMNARMQASRAAMVAEQGGEPPVQAAAPTANVTAQACESGQPSGLFWQTVWDATNRFYSGYTTTYSGTYYNMRPGDPGWSAMSGNYGSWWGQGYHVRKCEPYLLNQFYANDWPAHRNANVYSALKGTVEWAGWDYQDAEGYYTLGNYVVVRNGSYRAIMAHLTSIASGITWGATVGMNTVIGYAGKTGGPWDEHVHSRVAYGESLTYLGQPYGGNTVWPNRLRCVSCRASDPGDIYGNGDGQFDVKDSTGAKFYTRFYHGRWMRG
ncbi:MAG TPA: M23 family metallopeptidase [Longimicrobium sp.]|jgi:murein DD-endopeptidase MepM/ murein hydrolase activator NlpD|uniref:M23 family metallopeptidase n=1 Tax=Longimicrobium sp. TaxID=2029185 RepID=UPI002EDA5838